MAGFEKEAEDDYDAEVAPGGPQEEDDGEIDEEDLQMYEQFLKQQKEAEMSGGGQIEDYGEEQFENEEHFDQPEVDQESVYSEGELMTRMKLIKQKSYSAPYILFLDCFDEPLCDSESQGYLEHGYSTTRLQNIELGAEGEGEEEDPGSSAKKAKSESAAGHKSESKKKDAEALDFYGQQDDPELEAQEYAIEGADEDEEAEIDIGNQLKEMRQK